MKAALIYSLSLVLIFSSIGQAQGLRTLYYNSQWELTTKDSSVFYRTCLIDTVKNAFIGEVNDFTKGGQLIMNGNYQQGIKNGKFTFYYPSGQIESQGEFKNNIRVGTWNYFYPDGKPHRIIKFTGNDFFVTSLFDSENQILVKDGTGKWVYTYEWYGTPKSLTVEGNLVKGKMDGVWECSYQDGGLIYKETFKAGKFKNGFLTNPDGSKKEEYKVEFRNKFLPHFKFEATEQFLYRSGINRGHYPFFSFLLKIYKPIKFNESDSLDPEKKIFLVVEQPPEPEGGYGEANKFIVSNLKYPVSARQAAIEGTVYISFVVEKDGKINEAEIIKGVSGDLDQEALRVIRMLPNWKPGMQLGKPVRVRFVYPIKFKLG